MNEELTLVASAALVPGGSSKRLLDIKHATIERWLTTHPHTEVSVEEGFQRAMGRVFNIKKLSDYNNARSVYVLRDHEWSRAKLLANKIEIFQVMVERTGDPVFVLLEDAESYAPALEQLAKAASE